ncbi:retrotransposon protein, putative, ty1-copia subclass [Tanacetum coccineum]|uniref:Retrotransposon protein, putative, ty1-copia subclass n=1 Tax=Tanacetum coccineum TaxID=301880 RepID=A0ABQ5ANE1_9ASTR
MQRKERLLIPTGKERPQKESPNKRKVKYEIAPTSDPKEAVCFYYNTKGHWKRSCPKYLKDLKDGKVEKGSHSGMFMIELHNTITLDSWVMDTVCGTYIYTILQGLKESKRLKYGELNLVMGNRKITLVTRIGKYKLMPKSGVRIDLNNYCYSSEVTRNIISFHTLFKNGYKFSFDNENGDILVYSNGCFMFKASPCKGIYETVKCISHNGNVILNVGSSNELEKSKLWHSRLGHIDLEEIQESADEEPIVSTDTQQEVVTPVKPDDIPLPIRRTSGRVIKPPQFYYGFHIEEDKISDSTLNELDEPANYKEAMAIPEAGKWKEAKKSEIQSMYDNQVLNLVDT